MNYREKYELWLKSDALTDAEKAELRAAASDEGELESRFFANLQFGTAGLRGIMGLGTNRMNIHVIRHATESFARVILEEGPEAAAKGVAICHDCRINSRQFAEAAACVMAANGIPVRLFEDMRPTPELSFAIREYGCLAGINVTASHNPKEYNGYKVYWEDGAQLPPHHADAIAKKMKELDVFGSVKTMDYNEALKSGLITLMGVETDEKFLENVMAQATDPELINRVADSFSIVYTPFHGTGYRLIPEVFRRMGFKKVCPVPEQMVIDGSFPTVKSPNPENPEGFYLAVDLADRVGADFIIGSDPDADRVGILVRDREGRFVHISGNQIGVLMLDYVIRSKTKAGTMPERPCAVKSLVSTEMVRAVAQAAGVRCFNTFTGFKFLAEKKNALESSGEGHVIFAFEEAYGYMVGDYVRDKDAVGASLVLAEMAAYYYDRGMSLLDALDELYEKHGYYGENTLNLVMPGLDGLRKMARLMENLRAQPPENVGGIAVDAWLDYESGIRRTRGGQEKMEMRGSNVLSFELADGTVVVVRPSGTEPKVKVYILARADSREQCDKTIAVCANWAEKLKDVD